MAASQTDDAPPAEVYIDLFVVIHPRALDLYASSVSAERGIDNCIASLHIVCSHPACMCQQIGLQMQGGIDDLTATKAMGMGSWRLKGAMDPPFEGLTAQVEGLWRHMLDRDLKLYPMDKVVLLQQTLLDALGGM